MKTKSTSLARKALASPTFVARQPRLATGRDGPELANARQWRRSLLNKPVIGWMPADINDLGLGAQGRAETNIQYHRLSPRWDTRLFPQLSHISLPSVPPENWRCLSLRRADGQVSAGMG